MDQDGGIGHPRSGRGIEFDFWVLPLFDLPVILRFPFRFSICLSLSSCSDFHSGRVVVDNCPVQNHNGWVRDNETVQPRNNVIVVSLCADDHVVDDFFRQPICGLLLHMMSPPTPRPDVRYAYEASAAAMELAGGPSAPAKRASVRWSSSGTMASAIEAQHPKL